MEASAAPGSASAAAPAAAVQARQLADRGADLAAAGEYEAAAALFRRALQLDGSSASASEMLAQCLMAAGQDEEAYEAAAAAVRLRPGWPPALLTLGRAARNAGRLRDAAAALAEYLEAAGKQQRQQQQQPGGAARGGPPANSSSSNSSSAAAAAAALVPALVAAPEPAAAPAAPPPAAAADGDEAADAQQELEEVRHLLSLQLGHQIGLPGLLVLQQHGAALGPGGVAWEAGALLSWFLVQQAGGGGGEGPACCGHAGCAAQTACQQAGADNSKPMAAAAAGAAAAPPRSGSSLLRGTRVLELGAGGTGLVGLAAACLGAHVTATDLPEVLPQLEAAAAANAALVEAGGGSLRVALLDWRAPDPALVAPGETGAASAAGGGQPGWDWLLGADLVYSLAAVQPLVATVAAAARHADGSSPLRVLISHKHRHDEVDEALLGGLRAAGLPMAAVLRDAGSRCTVFANDAARAALQAAAAAAGGRC